MRRIVVLGATGALVAGTLAAASAALATNQHPGGGGTGTQAETYGVDVAAARAAKARIHWVACPSDWGLKAPVECGFVTVPIDYAKPDGATIKLAVDRARSTGTTAERQGALLYNPGGPGVSGMRFPNLSITKDPLWTRTSRAYDFVGFDPRGVGHSSPISCQDPREFVKAPKPDPVPGSAANKQAERKLAKEYAHGCEQRSGKLLPYLTTPNSARDMDVIRAALGEKKLNYYGVSYGTYLGAVYATMFPTHVRRMLVDSVVDPNPGHVWYQNNLAQDVAVQRRWRDFEGWVAQHNSVYHLGSSQAQIDLEWQKLLATAKRHPIGGVVGPAELTGFFQNATYFDQVWPPVADAWSRYAAGDAKPLIFDAGPDYRDARRNTASENTIAVYTGVECNDAKWPGDWHKWDRDNTALNAKYPFYTWANAWMNLPCATWGEPQHTPVDVGSHDGLPSVLIVQSARDAATPYAGAVELHRRLRGSELITEKDAGSHNVTVLVNPCINDRVSDYLVQGKLDGHDVVCGPHPAPEPDAAPTR